MRRDDVTLTLALCASLLVHGAISFALIKQATKITFLTAAHQSSSSRAITLTVAPEEPDDAFGRDRGRGRGANEYDSDQVLKGHQAPTPQAFLSRDPISLGQINNDPTMNTLPPGAGGAGGKPSAQRRQVIKHLAIQPAPFGVQSAVEDLATPFKISRDRPQPQAAARKSSAAPAAAGALGSRLPAADPAPMTESESDAFTDIGSLEVSAGKVEAKLGRRVKTVRPRLSVSSQADLVGLQFPRMKLRVRLDDEGNVVDLNILNSISASVDQEVKLAVFKWKFEPRAATRKSGPDFVQFEIVWR
ncbi:MAG TPA: hypothetical protein VF669_07945 [Tepidisphaeraceae bacterium]